MLADAPYTERDSVTITKVYVSLFIMKQNRLLFLINNIPIFCIHSVNLVYSGAPSVFYGNAVLLQLY